MIMADLNSNLIVLSVRHKPQTYQACIPAQLRSVTQESSQKAVHNIYLGTSDSLAQNGYQTFLENGLLHHNIVSAIYMRLTEKEKSQLQHIISIILANYWLVTNFHHLNQSI